MPSKNEIIAPSGQSAAEIIYWASKTFGSRVAVTSSFQTQSLPLVHLISRICPNLPIFFLNTGFHFSETLEYCLKLKRDLGLHIVELSSLMDHDDFLAKHGELYRSNPNMCCYLNKVEPLQRALSGYDAWISGIRRDQTPERSETPVLAKQQDGRYKICPMVRWTADDVNNYIDKHDLPAHPLAERGYLSIGCRPCTKAVVPGSDPRSGRWAESEKTECGLHFDSKGEIIKGGS